MSTWIAGQLTAEPDRLFSSPRKIVTIEEAQAQRRCTNENLNL